jgi:hypothetical protein
LQQQQKSFQKKKCPSSVKKEKKMTLVTKPASAEFYESGNLNNDRIQFFDEWNGKLVVEYSVRVPKDPRGFKRVVTKTGTWTSSAEIKNLKPDEKITTESYYSLVRSYATATSILLAGDGQTAIQFVDDAEIRPSFNYGGKIFIFRVYNAFSSEE